MADLRSRRVSRGRQERSPRKEDGREQSERSTKADSHDLIRVEGARKNTLKDVRALLARS